MPKHERALTAWTRSVSGSISLPSPGCFSPFPHGTVRYRSRPVGCLGRWSARLPTGLHVSRGTRDDCAPDALVVRDSHPLRCGIPAASHPDCPERWAECTPPGRSHNPRHATRTRLARAWFGRQPISLATTLGRLLLPQATEMFQFAWFPPGKRRVTHQQCAGLPHSETVGSMRGCRSPTLTPLTGVLHRLVVPRHPPTAHSVLPGLWSPRPSRAGDVLSLPSYSMTQPYAVGKVRRSARLCPLTCDMEWRLVRHLLELIPMVAPELGDGCATGDCGKFALPRKEVIQPHLPVRLPCYDFVPVARPTLGRWLPCGSPHGLQVFPTPMT